MFEKVVSDLLVKYLGQYIKDLQAENLNIGIWGGDVLLEDLELKEEALRSLDLPFGIRRGSIGKLQLKVPWKNLKSQPVVVVIDRVFLLAAPDHSFSKHDPQKEAQRAQTAKKNKLAQAEAIKEFRQQGQDTEGKDDGFLTKLVTKIVDNLQVEIHNVHIRFEDFTSNPEYPFAFGLCLGSLTARSTDENWVEMFIEDRKDKLMYKLAQMKDFSAYFDPITKPTDPNNMLKAFASTIANSKYMSQTNHHFLLNPISAHLKLLVHTASQPDLTIPKMQVELVFDDIGVQLEDLQFQTLLKLVSSLSSYEKIRQNLEFRPTVPIKSPGGAKLWWKYAGGVVLKDIRDKLQRRSWKFIMKRSKQRKRYVSLYKRKRKVKWLSELTSKELLELEQMEEELDFGDIIYFRSLADVELKQEAKNQHQLEEYQKTQPKKGWLSGWFGGGAPTEPEKAAPIVQLTESERAALYETIEFDEVMEEIDLPKDYTKIHATIQLKSASLSLLSGRKDGLGSPIIFSELSGVNLVALLRPDSMKVNIIMESTIVEDRFTKNNQFVKMVSKASKMGQISGNLLALEFEQNPLDKHADLVIKLDTQPLDIVVNKSCLERIGSFFSPPGEVELSDLKNKAVESMNSLSESTRAQLEDAIKSHKTIDLQVKIEAPTIILPEDSTALASPVLVLDLGKLDIKTDLQPLDKVDPTVKRKEEDFYDKFNLSLNDIQVLLVPHNDLQWRSKQCQIENCMHLVDRFSVNLHFLNSIQPNEVSLTKMKLSGDLPEFKVNFSPKKYGQIMRLINTLTEGEKSAVVEEHIIQAEGIKPGQATPLEVPDSNSAIEEAKQPKQALAKRKLLEAKFTIGKVTLNVNRNSGQQEHQLVVLAVEQLAVDFTQRSYDIIAKARLHSFELEDCLQPMDSQHRYLATSSLFADDEEDLISVDFQQIQKQSPEYQGVEVTANLIFNSFYFVCNRDTVSALIEFALKDIAKETPAAKKETALLDSPRRVVQSQMPASESKRPARTKPRGDAKFKANITLKTIALMLNREGELLAELGVRDLTVAATMYDKILQAKGSLYDITVSNLKPIEGGEHYSKIFSIVRDEDQEPMLDFDFKTFSSEVEGYPGWENEIVAQMRSTRFIFLNSFVAELQSYFLDGPIMASLLSATAEKAAQSAKAGAAAATQISSRNKMDITVHSPQIMVPRSNATHEMLSVELGKLTIFNEFQEELPIEKIQISLSSMNIKTAMKKTSRVGLKGEIESIEDLETIYLLGDVNTSIEVKRVLDSVFQKDHGLPQFQVKIRVSEFKFELTDLQLQLLAGTLNGNLKQGIKEKQTEQKDPAVATLPEQSEKSALSGIEASDEGLQTDVELLFGGISFQIVKGGQVIYPVAAFIMGELKVLFTQKNNSAAEASVSLESLLLEDRRNDTKNQFRSLISYDVPANGSDPQFKLNYHRNAKGEQDVDIAFIHPAIYLVPDAIYSIKDFFMPALEGLKASPSEEAEAKVVEQEVTASSPSGSEGKLSARVNIKDVEILFLDEATRQETRALIVKSSFLVEYSKAPVDPLIIESGHAVMNEEVKARIIDFQAFVCQPKIEHNELLPIAKPFNIDATYINAVGGIEIEVFVHPISFLFSYQDFKMITKILEALKPPESPQLESPTTVSRVATKPGTPTSSNKQAGRKIEKANIKCSALIFTLINDYEGRNLPLTEARISELFLEASSWSSELKASLSITITADYYNNNNVQFEPLLEYWSCKINVNQSENPKMVIEVASMDKLNLNITHSFVDTLGTLVEIFHKDYYLSPDQKETKTQANIEYTPYAVINCTGVDLAFETEQEHHQILAGERFPLPYSKKQKSAKIQSLKNETRFGSFQPKNFSKITDVSMDKVGKKTFTVENADKEPVQVICEVAIVDACKTMTISSPTVVKNDTTIPLEVCVMKSRDEQNPSVLIGPIAPGEEAPLPLYSALAGLVGVRPKPNEDIHKHHWSGNMVELSQLEKIALRGASFQHCFSCEPLGSSIPFFCMVTIEAQIFEDEPEMVLHLQAPLILENFLPCDMSFQLFEDSANVSRVQLTSLRGDTTFIYEVDPKREISLVASLPTWGDSGRELLHIPKDNKSMQDVFSIKKITEKLQFKDRKGRGLTLKVDSRMEDRGDRRVSLFSPYWVINKSTTRVFYRPSVFKAGKEEPIWGEEDDHKLGQDMDSPTLFSLGEFAIDVNKGKLVVKVKDSKWSKPFSVDSVGTHGVVEMKHEKKDFSYELGVSLYVGEGQFQRTKIIEFVPRHKLVNNTGEDVYFMQEGGQGEYLLENGKSEVFPYWCLTKTAMKVIVIKPKQGGYAWSAGFSVDDLADFVIKCKASKSGSPRLFAVAIEQEYALNTITLSKQDASNLPYRIENQSSFTVLYSQKGSDKDCVQTLKPAGDSTAYAWDFPMKKHELLLEFKDTGVSESYGMDVIESYDKPLMVKGKPVFVYSKADGPVRILCITEDKDRLIKETVKDTEEKGAAVSEMIEIEFKMFSKGVGLSLIDAEPKEILYISAVDLSVKFSQSNIDQKVEIKLGKFQMDNQLQDSYFPVMLGYVQRSPDLPFFHMSVVKSLENQSIDFFTYFSMLVQEMNFKVDDVWINTVLQFYNDLNLEPLLKQRGGKIAPMITPTISGEILDEKAPQIFPKGTYYFTYSFYPSEIMSPIAKFVAPDAFSSVTFTNLEPLKGYTKIFYISSDQQTFHRIDAMYGNPHGRDQTEMSRFKTSFPEYHTFLDSPTPYNGSPAKAQNNTEEKRLYFKFFTLNPIKLNITFSISPGSNQNSNSPLRILTQVLGSTFANLDDAPIRLNALALQDAFAKPSELQARIIQHYKGQGIREIYKVLGSADFIGNPVGLFSNISTGVVDFFYEPASGLIQSPEAFGKGLAKGSISLAKHTTYGLFNTVSKLTGTIGKSVASASFDDAYIQKRQIKQATEKPRHVGEGLLFGTRDLARGLWEGTTGLVTQPIKGAKGGGALGFAKGLGRGLAGTVVKPVVGVTDLVTRTSEGIRNTTTMFEPENQRVRAPRCFGNDGVLSEYTEKESKGVFLMRQLQQGAFRQEVYLYHEELGDNLMLIITKDKTIMANSTTRAVSWTVRHKSVIEVDLTEKGVLLRFNHEPEYAIVYSTDKDKNLMMYTKLGSIIKGWKEQYAKEKKVAFPLRSFQNPLRKQ